MTFLPTTVPPDCSTRVTIVASKSGTRPSSANDPKLIGTPATAIWSLKLTVLPSSAPVPAGAIRHFHVQAFSGSSSAVGRRPGVRTAATMGGEDSSSRACTKRSSSLICSRRYFR